MSGTNSSAVSDHSLALASMNRIADDINRGLCSVEQEVNQEGAVFSEAYIQGLKDYCSDIEAKVNEVSRKSDEKVARLSQTGSNQILDLMLSKMSLYGDRIRVIQSEIRKAHGSASSNGISTPAAIHPTSPF